MYYIPTFAAASPYLVSAVYEPTASQLVITLSTSNLNMSGGCFKSDFILFKTNSAAAFFTSDSYCNVTDYNQVVVTGNTNFTGECSFHQRPQ